MNNLFNCLLLCRNQSIVTNQDNMIEQILSEFNEIPKTETKLALLFFAATAQNQVAQELLLRLYNTNQSHANITFHINELKDSNFCTVNTDRTFLKTKNNASFQQYVTIPDNTCLKQILEQQSPEDLEFLKKSIPYLIDLLANKSLPTKNKLNELIMQLNLSPETSPEYPSLVIRSTVLSLST